MVEQRTSPKVLIRSCVRRTLETPTADVDMTFAKGSLTGVGVPTLKTYSNIADVGYMDQHPETVAPFVSSDASLG